VTPRGRPRTDRLAIPERAAAYLRYQPDASANAVWREIGGRRSDVLRVVRALRTATSATAAATRATRFLNSQSGTNSRSGEFCCELFCGALRDALSRVVRIREAIVDGDLPFAAAVAEAVELELVAILAAIDSANAGRIG